jgi:hypothetical protein
MPASRLTAQPITAWMYTRQFDLSSLLAEVETTPEPVAQSDTEPRDL